MWPPFSKRSSPSNSTFEFKVTAPEKVDLVTTLREVIPKMLTRMRGDQVLFVGVANPDSPIAPIQSFIEALTPMAVKARRSKKIQKPAIEQPRPSSRVSSGALELTSQTAVKANMDDGCQDPKGVKRRRWSSRRKIIL
jgi:hypothetical protein